MELFEVFDHNFNHHIKFDDVIAMFTFKLIEHDFKL